MATKSKKSPASTEAANTPAESAIVEPAAASDSPLDSAPETIPEIALDVVPEAEPAPVPAIVAAAPVPPAPTPAPRAGFAPGVKPGFGLAELADLGRENVAALTKSNLAFSEGLQAIGQEVLGYARLSFESASKTAKALLGARTLDEVIRLNSDLAKSSLETLMTRSAKLSEMSVAVANETLAPLGGRVEAAITKLTKSIAA